MAIIRLYMTMSLDGYVAGPQDSVDAPMGIGGFRLFNWLDRRNDPGPSGQVFTEVMSTRAVIAGRRTYEHADRWQGDHHDGVPVFVLTHAVPDDPPPGSVRYVTDVRECASQAPPRPRAPSPRRQPLRPVVVSVSARNRCCHQPLFKPPRAWNKSSSVVSRCRCQCSRRGASRYFTVC
jgi:hypothetical protein